MGPGLQTDVLLIGAGPAGLAAGAYLARAGWRTLILDRDPPGGQARRIDLIENYPGFPSGISGRGLMARFFAQGKRWGARFLRAEAQSLSSGKWGFGVRTPAGELRGRALVLCSGAAFKSLGLPGEGLLEGVSHAAFEDAESCRGRAVAVAGGGEAAAHQALLLSRYARKVALILRGERLKAIGRLRRDVARRPNVRFLRRSVVTGLHGRKRLSSIAVQSLDTGTTRRLAARALFVLIGKAPRRDLLRWGKAPPGFFLAGDVRQGDCRQVAIAAGDGVRAAMACDRYLRGDR